MQRKLNTLINQLVETMYQNQKLDERNRYYYINQLLEICQLESFILEENVEIRDIESILEDIMVILNETDNFNLDTITQKDLFDTKLCGVFLDSPTFVESLFWKNYKVSPEQATSKFYQLNQDINYIRRKRIARDKKWKHQSSYGEVDITINLSKPEKDPRDIASALRNQGAEYPACLLCIENEGFAGNMSKPARQNLRTIEMTLDHEKWRFQYSPYVYYNEHCIVLNTRHTPMKINRSTFTKMFDFVDQFPHYFVGSNADLPIVGGSILTHDHFQGGNYTFAMNNAKKLYTIDINDVNISILHWPLSVIRLSSNNRTAIEEIAEKILHDWRSYSDENVDIIAYTNNTPHNTITPIARFNDGLFELDLVLRNNRTSQQYPDGIFHPHQELHHIKKENIGLIEVMGLAVLPSRLLKEIELMTACLIDNTPLADDVIKHKIWLESLKQKYNQSIDFSSRDAITQMLEFEIGEKFVTVLEHSGVFKVSEDKGLIAFKRFIDYTLTKKGDI